MQSAAQFLSCGTDIPWRTLFLCSKEGAYKRWKLGGSRPLWTRTLFHFFFLFSLFCLASPSSHRIHVNNPVCIIPYFSHLHIIMYIHTTDFLWFLFYKKMGSYLLFCLGNQRYWGHCATSWSNRFIWCDASRHSDSCGQWDYRGSHGMARSLLWVPCVPINYQRLLPPWRQVDNCSKAHNG